jgi:hypothetical protein
VLWNAYLKARRQTERGAQGQPAAYVIPTSQYDPLTAAKMINKLLIQGIEVKQAMSGFTTADGMSYQPGSYVVSLAQPKMGLIRYLLGRTFYPDNEWTRGKDGSPMRPYDMATDTMFEFMGVRVDPVNEVVQRDLNRLAGPVQPIGKVSQGGTGYLIEGKLNDSFKVLNLLLDKGVAVRRIDKAGEGGIRPGDFVVPTGAESVLAGVAKESGVDFLVLRGDPKQWSHEIKRLRVGMYQRYWGGNIDEGWTRFLLEQYSFPYTTLMDAEIKKGSLNDKYDVIILPDDSTTMITGDRTSASGRPGSERGEGFGRPQEAYPPEYRSGIGTEGVTALKAFVQKGGTLVTLGGACNFAIEKLDLSVRNTLANRNSKEFWCPGSTLRAKFDNSNPLAYGMPSEGLVLYLSGCPAFEIVPTEYNERYETIVRYADRDLLQSGWLIGEEHLAKKAAMVSAKSGNGKVILIGFRTQHRAQTHATFKLLFNALVR